MKQYDFVGEVDENGREVISVANAPKRRKIEVIPMVICFFIALLIWLYMTNLNDTGVSTTITIPVTIEGEDELRASSDMIIYAIDKSEVIVTIKGSNRDLKKYQKDDYSAVVDVSSIISSGRYNIPVKVKVPDGSTITVALTEPGSVSLSADVIVSKTVPFDYLQGSIEFDPQYKYVVEKNTEYIELTGPKTVLDSIESAKFRLPAEEYSTSKSFSGFQLSLCDKNGDFITYDSSVLSYSTTDVTVRVNVIERKMIPVVVKILTGVSNMVAKPDIDVVFINGDPTIVNDINEYVINLASGSFGQTVSFTISDHSLPEGVTVENEGSVINISIENTKAQNE